MTTFLFKQELFSHYLVGTLPNGKNFFCPVDTFGTQGIVRRLFVSPESLGTFRQGYALERDSAIGLPDLFDPEGEISETLAFLERNEPRQSDGRIRNPRRANRK